MTLRDPQDWQILPQEVENLVADGASFVLIDCRKPEEYEAGHLQGAQLAPLQDIDLHLPALREHIDDLIVVYCRTGRRSTTVTAVLRDQGFANARSMVGGFERWTEEIGSKQK